MPTIMLNVRMDSTERALVLFSNEAAYLADQIIAGCDPRIAASYSESVFSWSHTLFNSCLHKANLEVIYNA